MGRRAVVDAIAARIVELTDDRIRELVHARAAEPVPHPMVVQKRCGCGWAGITSSTHCGSCGRRLIIPEGSP